jgi:hypothetical protein
MVQGIRPLDTEADIGDEPGFCSRAILDNVCVNPEALEQHMLRNWSICSMN